MDTPKYIHDIIIDVKNLTRGYPESPNMLFHDFNFALYKNEFCVLMGRSGIGKSTLLKFLIGEIKVPLRTIYHKREDLGRYTDHELQMLRRKIGIVFQDYKLINDLTAKENIVYPLKIYGLEDTTIEQKYRIINQKFGLQDIQHNQIKYLSSGEKQKVAIARALIHNPEFIIADEPTGNLDREQTQNIADILIECNKMGNTILLITHDVHLLEYLKKKHKLTLCQMK